MIVPLPLAAIGDWLQFLIPLVFFIIYAINQLLSGNKNKQQPPAPRTPPRRKPEVERPLRSEQPGAPPKPARGGQAQLNAEIEEFLKRAEQRRGESSRREVAAQRPPEPPQRRPVAPQPAPRRPAPLEPVTSDAEPRRDLSSVASSVEKHLGNRGFSQRAEHLADDISRADENMEEHLQQVFGHRVGTLSESSPGRLTPTTDAAPATQSASSNLPDLVNLVSDPQRIRQAIVLREILDRPEHRW